MADSIETAALSPEAPIKCISDTNSNVKVFSKEPQVAVYTKSNAPNGDIDGSHSDNKSTNQPTCSEESHTGSTTIHSTTSTNCNGKPLNGVKSVPKNSKINVLGNSLPLTPETWTVTSDSQIWLECCQNSFRACGGNVRSFQPHISKRGNNNSPNHVYSSGQGSTTCSPNIQNSNTSNSMSYNRNGNQYIVHLHVNPGETISFDMGDHVQLIQGPATVRMVSSNNTPPVPMPVQVPPGHMVQQIVDEHGTLRHIILSPQPPVAVSVGNPYNGSGNGNVSGSAPFYLYPPPSYPISPQFPPHMQPLHQPNNHTPVPGVSECASYGGSYRDERTQRQFFKLKRRLEARQKDGHSSHSSYAETSSKAAEDSVQNEDILIKKSETELQVAKFLSAVKPPTAADIMPTSALLEWVCPESSKEKEDVEISLSDLQYGLYLCDKSQNTKPKEVYWGKEMKFNLTDLKPATSYTAQVQVKSNSIIGNLSEVVTFKTLSSKPDAPQPPKLLSRTKTSISVKWNAAIDNGAKVTTYILEYDDGSGADDFVEIFNGLQKQFKVGKLKQSTCYKFRLSAVNEHGQSDWSTAVCFWTSGSAPLQPMPPSLQNATVHSLDLDWESRPNDDAYTLQMEDERTLHGFLPVYNGKDTSYTCVRLTHNTCYKFRLSANNEEGSSPWSSVVSYSTLADRPGKPGKPSVKSKKAHSTSFKMAWDPPKEDGGSPITEYILEMDSGDGFKVACSSGECEYLCEELKPGTCYFFRVKCKSMGGLSDFSDVGIGVTAPVVPGKCEPPRLHGKPKSISIHLKWNPPEYTGGSEILESEVEVIYPDENSRMAYRGCGTDCVVAGLLPGRSYKFRVRAYNKVGASIWSDTLEATSGAGPPDVPTSLEVLARSPHSVFASWAEPFHNGASISEYKLDCRCHDKEFELVYSGSANSTEVKSLVPATMYYFQVQAVNAAGSGSFGDCVSSQTPPSSPGSVSTAHVHAITDSSSLELTWKEPTDHGSPILGYNVEVGDVLHTTDVPSIHIEGLTPETTYKVRLQALNGVGPGPFSCPLKVSTRGLPPPAPLLECCGVTSSTLRLKWGDGKNIDLRTFTLEMQSPQTKRFVPVYQGPAYTFKVSKLQEATSYNFRVYASNEEGDGPCSDVFAFATHRALPPAVKAPKVSNICETSCTIEWLAAKAVAEDMLSYKLQLGTKVTDFHVVYTGIQTTFTVHHLEPGSEYSVRVAAVRHCSDGELPGPFSPCTAFCTETKATTAPRTPLLLGRRRAPLTDQQWALIILGVFTAIAITVAGIIQHILS